MSSSQSAPQAFTFEILSSDRYTPDQAEEIARRIHKGIREVNEHPDLWPGTTNIVVDIAHNADSWPDWDFNKPSEEERKNKAIPTDEDHCIWIFFDEHYVDADGDLRFE